MSQADGLLLLSHLHPDCTMQLAQHTVGTSVQGWTSWDRPPGNTHVSSQADCWRAEKAEAGKQAELQTGSGGFQLLGLEIPQERPGGLQGGQDCHQT